MAGLRTNACVFLCSVPSWVCSDASAALCFPLSLASWGSSRLKCLLKAFVHPVGLTVHNPDKRLLYVYVSDVLSLCLLHGQEDVLYLLSFGPSPFTMRSAVHLELGFLQGLSRDSDSYVSAYGYLINLKPFTKERALPNCTTALPLSTRRAPRMYSLSQTLAPSPPDSVCAVLNHYTVDLGYLVPAQVQISSMFYSSSRLCCLFLALCISIQILDSVCQFLLNNKKDRIVSISRCTNTACASIYLGLQVSNALQCVTVFKTSHIFC